MPRKLYVHVGPTKTGTSALQSVLSEHDGSIVLYPKAGQHGPHRSHHGLVVAFFQRDRSAEAGDLAEKLFGELAANVSGSKCDAVISSEWLMRRSPPEFIHHALSALGDDAWEAEILFGCRDHFERAASTYSQVTKGAESTEIRDPDEYLRDRLPQFLYGRMLKSCQEAGFRVTGLNYHPATGWIKRFLTHVGFSDEEIPQPKIKNKSLSTKALIAQLCANRMLEQRERRTFWKALQEMPGFYAPSQFIFGASAAADAERSFALDRKYVRDEFGVVLPEPDLANRESRFFIDASELADISAATRQLGDSAGRLISSVAKYLQA